MLTVAFRDLSKNPGRSLSVENSIKAAYSWLCRAQDATPDSGVSRCYSLITGWDASYPETTGYIIPTLLRIAERYHDDDARNRAIAMADWEVEVQLPNGAIQGGSITAPPQPAVFNTGQVIFGWIAAYEKTRDERYIHSARRAADWLKNNQDADGGWRKYLSPLTPVPACTYNARTAWALIQLGRVIGEASYIHAGRRNLDWCLRQQHPNGWFANNAFYRREIPLLHTIGYVIEGMIEAGSLLESEPLMDAAKKTASILLELLRAARHLHGCYDKNWRAPVRWRCLVGEAQVALTWLRLYEITSEPDFFAAAKIVNEQIMGLQETTIKNPALFGGIKGSHPIWGGYLRLSYPNWSVKFFLDSLLLQSSIQQANPRL